jgi:hypothetical protein
MFILREEFEYGLVGRKLQMLGFSFRAQAQILDVRDRRPRRASCERCHRNDDDRD